MSLLEEAKRVAAEFDYSAEDVVKGVEEFRRQMGMWLLGLYAPMSIAKITIRRRAWKGGRNNEPDSDICHCCP